MREQHAVNAELKSSGLLSAYGRMQTGRFGLLSIGRANVATRAGAEWPGLVGSRPAAFGRCDQLGDMNRLDFQRGRFGVVELGMKCEIAHFLTLRRQINQHLPVVTHPAVNRISPRGPV